MKRALLAFLVLAALGSLAIAERYRIMAYALASQGAPALLDPVDVGANVHWRDDYFTVHKLDDRTFAIGEPRYWQKNYSYLIVGTERAVLFDAGPGLRDIRPVAESLTDRPITFVPSHFHFDHVGNRTTFERVAVVDLPYLRTRAPDDRLELGFEEHLGLAEGIQEPTLEVDDWLAPGSTLQLGSRALRVLSSPGHTEDSISLLDSASGHLFTGDFLYPGPLPTFLPNSHMGDYLQSALAMVRAAPASARVFGAHSVGPPGVPELGMSDVNDLRSALEAIRDRELDGKGFYPVVYRVNDRVVIWAEPHWLQDWHRKAL